MLGKSIYAYVWQTSRASQIRICLLVSLVALLSVAPLELQRRMVDSAVSKHELWLLLLLGFGYLVVLLIQGGLKYILNNVRSLFKGAAIGLVTFRSMTRSWLGRRIA